MDQSKNPSLTHVEWRLMRSLWKLQNPTLREVVEQVSDIGWSYDAPDGSFGITGNTVTKLFNKYGAPILESFSLEDYRNSANAN